MSGRFRVYALILLAAILAVVFLLAWSWRGTLANAFRDAWGEFRRPLPEAVSYDEIKEEAAQPTHSVIATGPASPAPAPTKKPSPQSGSQLPASINLDVPFTSQAPFENWELPFKEACEEASLLMVDRFYRGQSFTKQNATNAILGLTTFQRGRFGYYEDTTAEETAVIAREHFGYNNVKVVNGPLMADMIKQEIAHGHPVILPMAGRLLGNRYFRQPGPYYHMLVVKGYTPTEFITNDPGTKRGQNYRYPYATLLNAIHDFDPLDIAAAPQAMIVVLPDR